MRERVRKTGLNIAFCFRLLYKANKKTTIFLLIVNLVNTLVPIAVLYMSRTIINSITEGFSIGINEVRIVSMIAIYFLMNITISFFEEYSHKISILAIQDLLKYINIEIMRKSASMDISYFDIPQLFDEVNISRDNAKQLHNIVFSLVKVLGSVIRLISTFVIAIQINTWFVIFIIASLIPKFFFSKKIELTSYAFEKKQAKDNRRVSYYYSLLFRRDAACEMRYYNFITFVKNSYLSLKMQVTSELNQFNNRNALYRFLLMLPPIAVETIVKIYTVVMIASKFFTVGDYTFVTGIYSSLNSSMDSIMSSIAMFEGYDQKISDFKKFFAYDGDDGVFGNTDIPMIKEIEFRNVCFTYPKSNTPTLHNLSFKITEGEKVMLVGENGAGKTTIVKLICGFYTEYEGLILINGIDIKKYRIETLRTHLSSVFQDFTTFSYTIRENVAFGCIECIKNDRKIIDCLKSADFRNNDFTNDNIDMYVNKEFDEDGIVLSGGQQQRLAIARAYMRDSQLVLMDEPNASLDPIAECELLEQFKKLYDHCMLLFISHRLSNSTLMDRILVLENGTVVEEGNHSELMLLQKRYYKMFSLQAEKYMPQKE